MCRRVARISALLTGPAEAAVDVGTRPCDAGPVATTNILTELLQGASMQAVSGLLPRRCCARLHPQGMNPRASGFNCPGQLKSGEPVTCTRRSDREGEHRRSGSAPSAWDRGGAASPRRPRAGEGSVDGKRGRGQAVTAPREHSAQRVAAVPGGAGAIGSAIVEGLVSSGHRAVVIDRAGDVSADLSVEEST